MALERSGAEEYEHFGRPAYRIAPRGSGRKPGRTFMTLWPEEGHAVLMLDAALQCELCDDHPAAFDPHPSKWGAKGATVAHLARMDRALFAKALDMAHAHAAR